MKHAAWMGALALLPAMVGPLPAQARSLSVALCAGGSMELPLPAPGGGAPAPCCAKGCRSDDRKGADKRRLAAN